MTKKNALKKGFTNIGYMFNCIPVYWRDVHDGEEDGMFEAVGKNILWDLLLMICIDVDTLLETGKSFEIWDGGLIDKK